MTGPIVVYSNNFLDESRNKVIRAESGKSIADLAPKVEAPVICIFNGEPALPEDWDYIPSSADHVRFQVLPASGIELTYVLYAIIALAVVVAFVAQNQNLANAVTNTTNVEASPTYSINFSANEARLGQSVPVIYGRHIIMPDFAARPYVEYDDEGNEYYHACFCIGMMEKYTLESISIDDTPIDHFESIETQFVGPNQINSVVTLIDTGVITAPEAANNDLLYGEYVGPFSVCGPGITVNSIGIDILCPKGLYFAEDDGSLGEKSVTWVAEARKITDLGVPTGSWVLLGVETLTDATNTPIRRSYKYSVASGRYEVRMSRQNARDDNSRAGHDIQWHGLRGYSNIAAPSIEGAQFVAIKAKATSQLSATSERKFTMVIRRWLRSWTPDDGWSELAESSSIAWACADILRNPIYGGKLDDSRIDLQTFYELDQIWTARNDKYNSVIDNRTTVWAGCQAVARCGRAIPIMRGNVVTLVRDQKQELPVAMFNMRNIERNSLKIEYTTIQEDSYDGVELEYFDDVKWASDWVTHAAPGVEGDPVNPEKRSIKGITNLLQAHRECAYYAALSYRCSAVEFKTEMEGLLPSYGNLVAISHDVPSWGASGDIETWDGSQCTVTENIVFGDSSCFVMLVDEYGDTFGPYGVVPGTVPNSFVFAEEPECSIYVGTERERTRFSFGPSSEYAKMCCIANIDPSTDGTVTIRAYVEDNRIHDADKPWFDGGGGTARKAHYAPDTVPSYDEASEAERNFYGFYSDADGKVGEDNDEGPVYDN